MDACRLRRETRVRLCTGVDFFYSHDYLQNQFDSGTFSFCAVHGKYFDADPVSYSTSALQKRKPGDAGLSRGLDFVQPLLASDLCFQISSKKLG